jgi:hypothetical protein
MTKPSIAGAIPNPSIVLLTGKATLPIKAGQANAFKAKAGEHYGNLKKKDAEEQLLDNVVAKPTGEDGKPLDAEGTGLTLQSAFIQAPVEGNEAATEAALEAAMPEQLAQGYQPSAQGAAGASLSESKNLGGHVFAYAGADALLLAQAETGITADVVASGAADPAVAAAGIGPLGILGIVGLGLGVAAAAGGSSAPDTLAPTLSITSNVAAVKTGETATITFTFSEATSNFVVGDITTTGGSVSNFTAVSGTVYTATFTPSASLASGSASITVASGAYTDAAGNSGGAGTTPTISIDTLAPTAVLSAVTDNVGTVTGVVASGGVTDDTVLVLSGTNEASATVNVYNGLTLLGAATISGTTWSYNAAVANATTYTFNAKETDVAGNVSAATMNYTITGDTTAPTVTNTSGAYTASTDTLVLTGTNYNTLLETSESATIDIKARLDWTKLSWDINGDNATTADVSFALSDISSAKVTDGTHLTIVLAGAKGTSLEATSGYGGATLDTLDITAGFAKDTSGNAATTDARADGVLTPSAFVAGDAVIDLGAYGKLIAPVQVEGAWYYYWDRSGDGTSTDTGSLNGSVDYTTHNVLDGIFTSTLSEVNAGTTGTGADTTDLIRYATLNGVKVALPTANGGEAYPQGINAYQSGTSYSDAGASTNGTTGTFNELLAIWDAYNGTGTGTNINGTPSGWLASEYWSATPSASGHAFFGLYDGYVYDYDDNFKIYVALQVL